VDVACEKGVELVTPNHSTASGTYARQLAAPNPEPDGFSRNPRESGDFFDEQ
jgi:hypothetical protein